MVFVDSLFLKSLSTRRKEEQRAAILPLISYDMQLFYEEDTLQHHKWQASFAVFEMWDERSRTFKAVDFRISTSFEQV